jgi:fumarate reductase subunit C
MAIKVRGRRVPARQIVAAHYLAWLVLSGAVAWLVLQ